MTACGYHSDRAARTLARHRAGPARSAAAVFGRTHKKDSFAALKILAFNDFSHFARCA
jgi:hypothetical protein